MHLHQYIFKNVSVVYISNNSNRRHNPPSNTPEGAALSHTSVPIHEVFVILQQTEKLKLLLTNR